MGLFKKSINVWMDIDGTLIFSKISVNGKLISKISCVLENEGVLLIGDIMPFKKKSYYSKGYGSMMMEELIKYASTNNINTVYGNLSLVDINHKDRLHTFYRKHGFKIVEYDSPKGQNYGLVVKKIII